MKDALPPSDQQNLLSVVNNFFDAINQTSGIIAAIDGLTKVVLSVANSYKEATGNVEQADLIFSLLKACLEGLSRLQETPPEGSCVFTLFVFVIFIEDHQTRKST